MYSWTSVEYSFGVKSPLNKFKIKHFYTFSYTNTTVLLTLCLIVDDGDIFLIITEKWVWIYNTWAIFVACSLTRRILGISVVTVARRWSLFFLLHVFGTLSILLNFSALPFKLLRVSYTSSAFSFKVVKVFITRL